MTAPTPLRPPGRPRDPSVTQRYIEAGINLIAEQGLHRLNPHVLARRIQAGKAGFYRRWRDVDDFLVDVVRSIGAVPVPFPDPRTPRSDLTALVVHQVGGDRGRVMAELLGRIRHSAKLQEAWTTGDGPFMTHMHAVADVNARLGIAGTEAGSTLAAGVDRLIAYWRERRLLGADFPVPAFEDDVDELLADVVTLSEVVRP